MRELYEKILQSPDDDAVRLVYADWCEETGDTDRAEFIRIQCHLAALDPWDPEGVGPRWREGVLFARNRRRWIGELPVFDGVSWGAFRRGFPAEVAARSADALGTHARALRDAAPVDSAVLKQLHFAVDDDSGERSPLPPVSWLRHLTLEPGYSLSEDEEAQGIFLEWEALDGLISLDLTSQGLGNEGAELVAASPRLAKLKRLTLGRNYVGSGGLTSVAKSKFLRGLEHLSIVGTPGGYHEDPFIDRAGIGALLSSPLASSLKSLDLSENTIDDDGIALLLGSRRLSALRSLDISDNLGSETVGAVAVPAAGPALKALYASRCIPAFSAIVGAPSLSGLSSLTLSGCILDDKDVRKLVDTPFFGNLRYLDLSGNPLTNAGVRALASKPSKLIRLDLAGCSFSDASGLSKLPGLANLEELDLSGPAEGAAAPRRLDIDVLFSDVPPKALRSLRAARTAGVVSLDSLAGSPDLARLDLQGTRPISLLALADEDLPSLTRLILADTGLSDRDVAFLEGASWLPQLAELDLSDNLIGPAGLDRLFEGDRLGSLEILRLSKTDLDDATLARLAGCAALSGLRELHIDGCAKATVEGIRAILDSPHLLGLTALRYWGIPSVYSLSTELNERFGWG